MAKREKIVLTSEERGVLENFSKTGERSAKHVIRALILLQLDTSDGHKAKKQEDIASFLGVSRQLVNDARRSFLSNRDLTAFLQRQKRETPPVEPKITGEVEAHIIALACSKPPEGYARWTMRLLADKCVELHYIDSISGMSVCRVLKKRNFVLT